MGDRESDVACVQAEDVDSKSDSVKDSHSIDVSAYKEGEGSAVVNTENYKMANVAGSNTNNPELLANGKTSEACNGSADTGKSRSSDCKDDGLQPRQDRSESHTHLFRNLSFRLHSQHGPILEEEMRVNGSMALVRVEDERLTWTFKKTHKLDTLDFAEVFAAVPLFSKVLMGPARSFTAEDGPTIRRNTVTGARPTLGRLAKESPLNTEKVKGFALYTLNPQKSSQMMKTEFLCDSSEMGRSWLEMIKSKMQDFGLRPRRLFVVINPKSGKGNGIKIWLKVQELFEMANIETEILLTKKRGHGRDIAQSLSCLKYDGVVGVGGDGLFNELMNGLLVHAQFCAGVNLRRQRFIPVQPNLRIGMIPCGHTNTVAHSVLSSPNPVTAAIQIILGRSTSLDVCSINSNNQLSIFCACGLNYGISNLHLIPKAEDMSWFNEKISTFGRKLSNRSFDATLSYVPCCCGDADPEAVLDTSRCSSVCEVCSLNGPEDSPSRGSMFATASATFVEVDKADEHIWRTIEGKFKTISIAPHICASAKHPSGMAPYGHFGDGCINIILESSLGLSKLIPIKSLSTQVDVIKAKEFEFDAFLHVSKTFPRSRGVSPLNADTEDEDEKTDRIAAKKKSKTSKPSLPPIPSDKDSSNSGTLPKGDYGNSPRQQTGGEGGGGSEADCTEGPVELPPGCWVVDGEVTNMSSIKVRVHRQLISVFGYKPPSLSPAIGSVATESKTTDAGSPNNGSADTNGVL